MGYSYNKPPGLAATSIESALLQPASGGDGLELFVKLSNGDCLTLGLGVLTTVLWAEQATAAVGEHTRHKAMKEGFS